MMTIHYDLYIASLDIHSLNVSVYLKLIGKSMAVVQSHTITSTLPKLSLALINHGELALLHDIIISHSHSGSYQAWVASPTP